MGISYEGLHSPAVQNSQHGLFTAGQPCPDLYLIDNQDITRRLYSLVDYGKYLVLAIGTHDALKIKHEDSIAYFNVQAESLSHGPPADGDEKVYRAGFVGIKDNYVVIIRPDMYVGCVSLDDSWKEYLDNVLGI